MREDQHMTETFDAIAPAWEVCSAAIHLLWRHRRKTCSRCLSLDTARYTLKYNKPRPIYINRTWHNRVKWSFNVADKKYDVTVLTGRRGLRGPHDLVGAWPPTVSVYVHTEIWSQQHHNVRMSIRPNVSTDQHCTHANHLWLSNTLSALVQNRFCITIQNFENTNVIHN